jgi:hypothetical protein
LCACYFCAGGFDFRVAAAELLVEREANGLDGDVGATRLLEEGSEGLLVDGSWGGSKDEKSIPQDARGDVATAANGDHKVGLEFIEDLLCSFLAELVDLCGGCVSVMFLSAGSSSPWVQCYLWRGTRAPYSTCGICSEGTKTMPLFYTQCLRD